MSLELVAWAAFWLDVGILGGIVIASWLERVEQASKTTTLTAAGPLAPTTIKLEPTCESVFHHAPLATESYLRSSAPPGFYRVTQDDRHPVFTRCADYWDIATNELLHDVLTMRVARIDQNKTELPQGVRYAGFRGDGCRVVVVDIAVPERGGEEV